MSKVQGRLRTGTVLASVLTFLSLLFVPVQAAIEVCDPNPPHQCVAGTDGALDLSSSFAACQGGALANGVCTIDLAAAGTATWNVAGPTPGRGVYDPSRWAVVFKYTSVNVPVGVTVRFANHASRAPVVWLVSGNVAIDGTVDVSGASGVPATISEPGPGGFRGAKSSALSGGAGFGPGGGPSDDNNGGGSYATLGQNNSSQPTLGPVYGNARVVPLLGGSGGGSRDDTLSAGAGGGAILIAANGTVTVNGFVLANGGSGVSFGGRGSGGGIRIVADRVDGTGTLEARGLGSGPSAGVGRIRLDANTALLGDISGSTLPAHTSGLPCAAPGPGCVAQIWPDDVSPTAPEVRVAGIGGQVVPSDPVGRFVYPLQDVSVASTTPVTVAIETRNVPSNWAVKVRATPVVGMYVEALATDQGPSSNPGWELWTASVALPTRFSAVQVRASAP